MSNLPAVTGQRLIKSLHKIGFEVIRRKGSHNFIQHADGRCTVVPVHSGETIGLILCAAADAEQVELFQLDAKSIRVSEYLTELPPLALLQTRLHQAIEHAREQAARRETTQECQL